MNVRPATQTLAQLSGAGHGAWQKQIRKQGHFQAHRKVRSSAMTNIGKTPQPTANRGKATQHTAKTDNAQTKEQGLELRCRVQGIGVEFTSSCWRSSSKKSLIEAAVASPRTLLLLPPPPPPPLPHGRTATAVESAMETCWSGCSLVVRRDSHKSLSGS